MARRRPARWVLVCGLLAITPWLVQTSTKAQDQERSASTTAKHAAQYKRLLIRNAMVIYGSGKPPFGPVNIHIEDGRITRIQSSNPTDDPEEKEKAPEPDAVIDATGKYVMPGMVNTHMHWHEERKKGIPMPIQYERNLYLASGTTTAREVGGDYEKSKKWRAQSAAHQVVAPRILVYERPSLGELRTPEAIRAGVRKVKETGGDGLKIGGLDRDQLEALLDEAQKVGLRTTTHIGVEETTARDYVELGVDCIEHFYGVADAALDGIQNFPPETNYTNELHRFGRAGELYIQPNLNRAKLSALLDLMVAKGVAWSPTMSTYEASRDLIKAQNLPWYEDYLHPSLAEYYKPSLQRHATYWLGWTNTQEVRWRHTYRVWMDALREFGVKGGVITTGDDAGYLYGSLYGFGMIRELELHEEAGFHPLEVIKHATANGAKVVGLDDRIGRVRVGLVADLLVVNGNPLENLRLLSPYGADVMMVGDKVVNNYSPVNPGDTSVRNARGGGIEWTLKDGIPYHVPTLMKEVKEMVDEGRASLAKQKSETGQ
ncbi:MAG: amidohydrolase family protein [Vicinamibacteraceae bacterium]